MALPQRIAVTGAAGHLGRDLVRALLASGVEHVVALDRGYHEFASERVHFHQVDIRSEVLPKILTELDALVHLAFIVERGSRDGAETESINVGGSQHVFRSAASAGVEHVVYASSIASYGFHPENDGRVLTEDAPLRGNDDFYYARHKAAVERWLESEFLGQAGHMKVARLRPSAFLATGHRHPGAGLPLNLWPYVEAPPIQLTHQDDVVSAFLLALEKGLDGAYNVASPGAMLWKDIARMVGKRAVRFPKALVIGAMRQAYRRGWGQVDPVWLEYGFSHELVVSSQKLLEAGWQPRYPDTPAAMRAIFSD